MLVLGGAGYATHRLGRGGLHIRGHVELSGADSDRHRFRFELSNRVRWDDLAVPNSTRRGGCEQPFFPVAQAI